MEVLENEKLKWERELVGQVFPRYFEFFKTFTNVSVTYGNTLKDVFYFFYKITCRKHSFLANHSSHFQKCYFVINDNNDSNEGS